MARHAQDKCSRRWCTDLAPRRHFVQPDSNTLKGLDRKCAENKPTLLFTFYLMSIDVIECAAARSGRHAKRLVRAFPSIERYGPRTRTI